MLEPEASPDVVDFVLSVEDSVRILLGAIRIADRASGCYMRGDLVGAGEALLDYDAFRMENAREITCI